MLTQLNTLTSHHLVKVFVQQGVYDNRSVSIHHFCTAIISFSPPYYASRQQLVASELQVCHSRFLPVSSVLVDIASPPQDTFVAFAGS